MSPPSTYSPELALQICEQLAEGKSLRSICASEGMPSQSMVFRWLDAHESFREQYARARDMQADTLADDILHIADTPQKGETRKTTVNGIEVTEEDMLGHRRLQIDTRKWIAAKLKPKKYGEKIEQTHKGSMNVNISPADAKL